MLDQKLVGVGADHASADGDLTPAEIGQQQTPALRCFKQQRATPHGPRGGPITT